MQEWMDDFNCIDCEQDAVHEFARVNGAVRARCTTCGFVSDIDPDFME